MVAEKHSTRVEHGGKHGEPRLRSRGGLPRAQLPQHRRKQRLRPAQGTKGGARQKAGSEQ
jgi:hypothetical protein